MDSQPAPQELDMETEIEPKIEREQQRPKRQRKDRIEHMVLQRKIAANRLDRFIVAMDEKKNLRSASKTSSAWKKNELHDN